MFKNYGYKYIKHNVPIKNGKKIYVGAGHGPVGCTKGSAPDYKCDKTSQNFNVIAFSIFMILRTEF
jgi:hypothetical protein